jgi:DNA-binding NtrC family response regulator
MKSILVLSKRETTFRDIAATFRSMYKVDHAVSVTSAIEIIRNKNHDFLFVDLDMLRETDNNGYKSALKSFWLAYPDIEIIVMAPQEMIREAVMVVKAGASNYLTYPLDPVEQRYVTDSIYRSRIMQSELDYLRDKFWDSDALGIIQTKSPIMKKVFEKIQSVAPTRSTVLLIGETGTGKSVLAKLIHKHSNRKNDQFISVHCGAIPETLIESELFGHEKGAFTGAVRKQLGKFEIARGGTIFLDEIGTITSSAQIKLLQILQEGIFSRVGGEEIIDADVRVIAASNMNLKEMTDRGQFRKDLYYRLNVFPIEIPPLTERIDDIPLLVQAFISKLDKFYSKEIYDIHPSVLEAFHKYSWPGNIRELENLIERAYIIESSTVLTPDSFPSELFCDDTIQPIITINASLKLSEARQKGIEQIERSYLNELLTQYRGRINDTAKATGISTRQLHKLMKRYGLRKEDFK